MTPQETTYRKVYLEDRRPTYSTQIISERETGKNYWLEEIPTQSSSNEGYGKDELYGLMMWTLNMAIGCKESGKKIEDMVDNVREKILSLSPKSFCDCGYKKTCIINDVICCWNCKKEKLSPKAESKGGFSEEDMNANLPNDELFIKCLYNKIGTDKKYQTEEGADIKAYRLAKKFAFQYFQSLPPPTSKGEAKSELAYVLNRQIADKIRGESKIMTIEECRDFVAKKYQHENWIDALDTFSVMPFNEDNVNEFTAMIDEAMTLYSNQKSETDNK